MRSNQAALQLGSQLERYMARCESAEAGGDAVHRSRVLGERFDVGATRSDRGESVIRDDDRKTIDSTNRLDLTAAADSFTATVTDILLADRRARESAERSRDSLLSDLPTASVVNL